MKVSIQTGIPPLDLFLNFLLIGLFTFGGGANMVPLLQQTVSEMGWLAQEDFLRYIAISECTPGPIAVNMATFIGSAQAGILGAICATVGVILPSFIIILLIAALLRNFLQYPAVRAILDAIRPIITGMILASGLVLLLGAIGISDRDHTELRARDLFITILLAAVLLLYRKIRKKSMPIIGFILTAAGIGLLTSFLPFF